MGRASWKGVIASAILATACASTSRAPTALLVESRASVRVAEEIGAHHDARAMAYLELARRQIDEGERYMSNGDYSKAQRSFERAHANAELAAALADEANARAEAVTAQREVQALDRTRPATPATPKTPGT